MIKFIRGSKSKAVEEHLQYRPLFGVGKMQKDAFWNDLHAGLLREDYIKKLA